MMRTFLGVAMGCALLAGSAVAEDGFVDLIGDGSLDAWIKQGGTAPYTVEDGCIVGTAVLGTENTFLCTKREYADFILEYEFKVSPHLNSGVQIRSHEFDEPTVVLWEDQVIKVPAKRLHGYQVEIDPEPAMARWWLSGVYDEACRGWLYPGMCGGDGNAFRKQGLRLFKQGEWNSVRIEAIGNSIKTYLNGEVRADFHDSRVQSGVIGLQVHGIRKEIQDGAQIRWRNLRIKDLGGLPNTLSDEEKAAGWRLLWDGQTTKGWRSAKTKAFPEKGWEVKNGMLVIHKASGAGDIMTDEKFSDFELKLDFKLTPGANSGIKIFVDPENGPGPSLGPEFQILDDQRHPDANKGPAGTRKVGSLYDLIAAPADKKVEPVGGWNEARILSRGNKVTFWLNGQKTVEIERGSEEWRKLVAASKYKRIPGFGMPKEGHILLQDHYDEVFFCNIKIRTTLD